MSYSGPATGLYVSPNPFNAVPDGSLADATNVRFTHPGVLGPRLGLSVLENSTFGNSLSRADSLGVFKHLDDSVTYLIAYDGTKVAEKLGIHVNVFLPTYTAPSSNRMRFENAAKSVFWNTTQGLVWYDGVSDPAPAGCPAGLSLALESLDEANGWLPGDQSVAYRYTVCRKDAYGRLIEGAPSGRLIVRNSIVGTAGNVGRDVSNTVTVDTGADNPHYLTTGDLVFIAPPGDANFPAGGPFAVTVTGASVFTFTQGGSVGSNAVDIIFTATRAPTVRAYFQNAPADVALTTDNFLRLYRSENTDTAAATPSDDLFLVFQTGFLSAANITAGYLDISDITPEGFITGDQATALYTDPNFGDGITAAKLQPPVSRDIVYWANRMWFANTYQRQFIELDLIGTGSPDGLQMNDTVTIAGTVYTAKTPPLIPIPGVNEFTLYTASDPGTNIEKTALSLVNKINSQGQTDVWAYYISNETGTPGKILLVARDFGSAFFVFSSRGTAWAPVLSADGSTYTTTSSNNQHPARLVYSPLGIPDAVTSVNYTEVNSDNDPILRIFPLHYRLLVFKTDGIYYITNIEPFTVLKLSDYKLIAPDSVHQLEDKVYALTDAGEIEITDGGVQRISIPIDSALQPFNSPINLPTYSQQSFGIGHRVARQSILWTMAQTGPTTFSTVNTQAWVYSTLSGGYTRYGFGAQAAVVNPNTNELVLAPTDSNQLYIENATLTREDFADLPFEGVFTSVSGSTIVIQNGPPVNVGDVILVSTSVGDEGRIVVAVDGNTLTVLGEPGWIVIPGVSTFTIYQGISTSVVFNKLTGGSPAIMKMWRIANYLWRTNQNYSWNASFSTEVVPATENVAQGQAVWGAFNWGVEPWGNPCEQTVRVEPLPEQHGNACQLSVGFNTRQAFANFEFLGVDIISKADSEASRSR